MTWPNTVTKKDLRIDYYRGSGKGGQHRNKTDSAVRITHIPTGLVAQSEEHKEQPKNKKQAFIRLTEKLVPIMKKALISEKHTPSKEVIRTYHEPRDSVKDKRVEKTYSYTRFIEGKCLDDLFIEFTKTQ